MRNQKWYDKKMELSEKIQWFKDNREKMTLRERRVFELFFDQSGGVQPANEIIFSNQKRSSIQNARNQTS